MLPLEKAHYRAIAIATTLGTSSQKGTPFVAVNFQIVDDEQYAGETTPAWLGYITDRAQERTVESLQHMGYEGDNLEDFADLDRAACEKLLPNVVEIVCEPEAFTGDDGIEREVLKVQWVNRVGGGRYKAEKPLEGSELKAVSAQMRSVFKNARGPRKPSSGSSNGSRQYASNPGAASRAIHPNAPGSANDDDIPF